MTEISKLYVVLGAKTDELSKGLENVRKRMSDLGNQFTSLGKQFSMKVTAPIVAGLGIAVKGAADLEGALAKFDVVFGEFADDMHEWVSSYRKEFPLARREIVKHAADLQDLLVPMGVARGEATEMTQEWLHLAGALAAFNDVPIEEALNAIRSGVAGQTEPLRRFGINANVAALEETALAHGLMSAGEEMSAQVRQQALLIQAYEQSSDAVDGLEEQKGSLLWMMQEIGATIKDIGDSFGTILLPYVKKAAEFVQELLQRFEGLDEGTQRIIIVMALVAAAIGPVLLGIGMLMKVMALLASPIGLIVGVLVVLGAAIYKLWTTNEEFREGVLAIWETIKNTALALWEAVTGFWNKHGEKIIEISEKVWQNVETIFTTLWQALSDIFTNIYETAKFLFGKLQDFWEKWGGVITQIVSTVFKGIRVIIVTVINVIKDIIGFVLAIIRGDWGEAFDRLKSIAKTALNFVVTTIRGILGNLPKIFLDAGKNIITSLVRGIKNSVNLVKNAVTGVVDTIRRFLPFSPAKEGPLKKLPDFADYFVRSFKDAENAVGRGMEKLAGMAMPDLSPSLAVAGGAAMVIKHDVDLSNVPAGINSSELKAYLKSMFNDPVYQRELDHAIHKISSNRSRPGGIR